jgi:hypothetical protein
MIFNFFEILMIFIILKKFDQTFSFHIYFYVCAKLYTKKKAHHEMCIWMFLIALLHFAKKIIDFSGWWVT